MSPALPKKYKLSEARKSGVSPALPKPRPYVHERNKTWYYVYLLSSKVTKWIYIGCTSNLKKRLVEHKQGKIYSTKKMLPVELIYFEAYRSTKLAFEREKSLKKYGSGLAKLKSRLDIAKKGRAG